MSAGVNERAMSGLKHAIPRLREIRDGEKCYGVAAIDVLGQHGGVFLSGKAVGGLVNPHGRHGDSFVGVIDHIPTTARRDAGEMAAPRHCVDMWMSEQMALLEEAHLSEIESILASYSICDLGYDPKGVLQGLWVRSQSGERFILIRSIGHSLRRGLRLGFPVSPDIGHYLDQLSG